MEETTRSKDEVDCIRNLLGEDRRLWKFFCLKPVSNHLDEMCCGWSPTRPSAVYDLTKPKRRNVVPAPAALSVVSKDNKTAVEYPYMSGELDENYTYVYKGGLSDRAEGSTSENKHTQYPFQYQPQLQKHVQTVTLEPSFIDDASAHAASCRAELSRILSLQLKPELLVEQLIIENRLRAMSLAAFPVLEGSESQLSRSDRTYSHSTPALPNTHVNYQTPRHRRHRGRERTPQPKQEVKPPHMQWCDSLSSQRSSNQKIRYESHSRALPHLSHCRSALHHRERNSVFVPDRKSTRTITTSSDHSSMYGASNPTFVVDPHGDSLQYHLPVVAPTLSSTPDRQSGNSKRLSSLHYKPERQNDSTRHYRSTSGSALYYPHSHFNSKLMKFK